MIGVHAGCTGMLVVCSQQAWRTVAGPASTLYEQMLVMPGAAAALR